MTSHFKLKRMHAIIAAPGILLSPCLVVSNEITQAPAPNPIDTLVETQLDTLSPGFSQKFATVKQLTAPNIREYASKHPREIVAIHRYLTMLADQNIVPTQTVSYLTGVLMDVASQRAGDLATLSEAEPRTKVNPISSDRPPITTDLSIAHAIQIVPKSGTADLDVAEAELSFEASPFARAIALEELKEKEKKERNIRLAAKIMADLANSTDKRKTIVERVNASIGEFVEKETTDQIRPFLDNTQVSVRINNGTPEYELRGLKILGDESELGFGFTEFGVIRSDGDTTLNIGIGSRLSDPRSLVMIGANGVLDYEPNRKHSRASIGLEAISKPFQLYANRYYVLSNPYQVNGTTAEYALNGRDIKLQAAVPYLPKTYLGITDFKWYGENGYGDIEGARYTLDGYLGAGWSLELERTEFSSGQKPSLSGKLSYNYSVGNRPDKRLISTTPFAFEPLPKHLKVGFINRQNVIAKQTTVNGLTVTFEKL